MLDGIFLSLVARELRQCLEGRVDKVYQPSKEELVLSLRTREGPKRILFNTASGSARVHLTQEEIENPAKPPMLCMLLRKHLAGGRLADIRQHGLDRVIMLDFDCTNELGDPVRLTLAAELMGRRSNLMLLDGEGRIIDCVKRITQETAAVPVLPGVRYEPPGADDRLDLLSCDREALTENLRNFGGAEAAKAMMKLFQGISPVIAREMAFRAGAEDLSCADLTQSHFDRLWSFVEQLRNDLDQGSNSFTILKENGRLKDFAFCDITCYGSLMEKIPAASPSQLLDKFYSERDRLARTKQRAADLFRLLTGLMERTERRVKNQRLELQDCADRERLRQLGDLITANIYALEKGMTEAELLNYFDPDQPMVKVKLDVRLTPSQNAQKYYKEYRKLDTAEKKLRELIAAGEEEIRYLDTVYDALTRASTEGELAEIREELAQQGYLKRSRQKGKPPKSLPPMRFVSSEGYEIKVGRNNTQNDRLTCREAKKGDLWLHTKDITGSHVIVSVPQGETLELPPDRTIEEAAVIAAWFSKGRDSSRVDVDYTFVKNVHKPSGAKPGMVIFYENYTITVKPDEGLVESLRA